MATCDVNTLMASASCFACQPPGVWPILELQLLCEISAALGASGGATGVSCAAGAPTSVPVTPCALYIDTNNGTLYEYYNGAWH